MPNINPSEPVWLFDLDNTLHDASYAIFPAITARMNAYIADMLGDGTTPASADAANAVRASYWLRYGATLLGLIKHHQVHAADFLSETHRIGDLTAMIRAERGLGKLLRSLPGRKILLTNAPRRYSREVLRHLGLQDHFSHHIAIESMHVHGQLRPKPSKLMLRRLMRKQRLQAGRCILVEDTLANLRTAKTLGLRTVWTTQYLRARGAAGGLNTLSRPAYVDVKVNSIKQLRARLQRLR
jgi:putative hydrolase of the HAD superfamily